MFTTMTGYYHPTIELLKEIEELKNTAIHNASSFAYPDQNGAYGDYGHVEVLLHDTQSVLMLLLIQRLDNLTKAIQQSAYDPREVE